jgi:hypothetical protein
MDHNGDPTFSTTEANSYKSLEYHDRGQPPAGDARDLVPTERPSPPNAFSPRSDFSYNDNASISEYSQTLAIRGAQELLKKNCQKRLEMATWKHWQGGSPSRRWNNGQPSMTQWRQQQDERVNVNGFWIIRVDWCITRILNFTSGPDFANGQGENEVQQNGGYYEVKWPHLLSRRIKPRPSVQGSSLLQL